MEISSLTPTTYASPPPEGQAPDPTGKGPGPPPAGEDPEAQALSARTAVAQIAADELGTRPEDVSVPHGDTAVVPLGFGTGGSRGGSVGGTAGPRAARVARALGLALAV